jgi:hypothetical protein
MHEIIIDVDHRSLRAVEAIAQPPDLPGGSKRRPDQRASALEIERLIMSTISRAVGRGYALVERRKVRHAWKS